MAKKLSRRKANDLDSQIEQAWYKLASGVQVDIMAIPRIFDECRQAVASGSSVDEAVMVAIAKHRCN